MICYIDTSVVIRKLFGQENELREWSKVEKPFSSRLLRLEALRTLDRWRHRNGVSSELFSLKNMELNQLISKIGFLPLTDQVFHLAELPTPVPIASLDSIHLATALLWKKKHGKDFIFATHDLELGHAVRSYGIEVIGI